MQLFNNLLENSLRYTGQRGSLNPAGQRDKTVRLTLPTVRHKKSVTISYKNCLNVFIAPKVPATVPAAVPGWGWICLNIVEVHNGRIIAAHSPFGGVSITVSYRWNGIYREKYDRVTNRRKHTAYFDRGR